MYKSASKVLYFDYCIFKLYIFLYHTVVILWTAKEEFHCITENIFLYCAYDNKHFESLEHATKIIEKSVPNNIILYIY